MFSFGKKKKEPKKKITNRSSNSKRSPFDEFGLGPQPDDAELEAELQAITGFEGSLDNPVIGEDDSDVEAELMRLIGAGNSKKPIKKNEHDISIPPLKDIKLDVFSGSIEEGEDDVDIDENDPELLNELLELTSPMEEISNEDKEDESSETEDSASKEETDIMTILSERLDMYKTAERKAIESNETSRARRFNRGIKTIQDLIKKTEKGQLVLIGDVPPLIATNLKPPPPTKEITEEQADGDRCCDQLSKEQNKETLPDVKWDSILKGEKLKPKSGADPPKSVSDSDEKIRNEESILDVKKIENENIDNIPKSPPKVPPKTHKEKPTLNILEAMVKPPELPSKQPPKLDAPNIPGNSKRFIETDSPLLMSLKSERQEYKILALKAKKNNDLQSALEYVKKVKEITAKITSIESGEPDSQDSPTSPPSQMKIGNPVQNPSPKRKPTSPGTSAVSSNIILEAPKTVLEALEQRLRIYNDLLQKSEKLNDKTSVLKNRKIVQIYLDAIRLHKMGKKVPLEKLPTCPGCPPMPLTF